MTTSTRRSGVLVGLAFLAVGVLFLLENFTDWEIPWGRWWPAILIVWGVSRLMRKGSRFTGTIMVVLGGVFLLDTLDVWEYTIGDIWRLWPVVLILIGARILFARRKTSSRRSSHQRLDDKSTPGELNITSIFGSNHRKVTDQALAGGQVVSVFGSAEIDLRDASLAGGEATLDITAVFGGAAIRIPPHWAVDQQIANFLGGVDDKRAPSPSTGAASRLTLTGTAVFGGIELTS